MRTLAILMLLLLPCPCVASTNFLLAAGQYTRIRPMANPAPMPDGTTRAYWDRLYSGLDISFSTNNNVPVYTLSPTGLPTGNDKRARVVAVLTAQVKANDWNPNFDFRLPSPHTDGLSVPSVMALYITRMDTNVIESISVLAIADKDGNPGSGIVMTPKASAMSGLSISDPRFMDYVDVGIKHTTATWFDGQLKLGGASKSKEFDEFYAIEWHYGSPASYNMFLFSDNYGSVAAGAAAYDNYFTIILTARFDGTKGIR